MSSYLLNELSVVIPSKNSEQILVKNFQKLIQFLEQNIKYFEIVIISNGSSLENIKRITNLNKLHKEIYHKILTKSGKGFAVKKGIEVTKYDNVLISDADFSVSIDELFKFVKNKELLSGLVIGNRRSKQSKTLNTPFARKVTGFIYIKIVNLIFNLNIEDTQCGFKCIDKKRLTNILDLSIDGFSYDIELLILAKNIGINILSVPVTYIHNDKSSVKIFVDSLNMIKEIFKLKKKYN